MADSKKKTATKKVTRPTPMPTPAMQAAEKQAPKMPQRYNVPDHLVEMMEKRSIYVDLRVRYINKKYGGFRKAISCSKKMIKISKTFFKQIVILYPELSGKRLSYDDIKKVIIPVG